MKTFQIALIATLSCSLTATAQPAPETSAAPKTPEARPRVMDPAARSNMLAKTGGLIQSPSEGPQFLFLNTQTRIAATVLNEPVDQIGKLLRFPIARKDAPNAKPITAAINALQDDQTAAVIVLGDSDGFPSLLIAPENRWAMVNVAALASEAASPETLAIRTQKEVWRAFGYLMGAAYSNFEGCLMKPVLSLEDLDALKGRSICPEPFNHIMAQGQKLGIKPQRVTTYRKAVEEGWAPAPTNDFQKAIWDELKK